MQIPFFYMKKRKQNLHPKIRTAAEAQKIAYWAGIRKSRFLIVMPRIQLGMCGK